MWDFKDHIKYNFGSKQEQLKDMLKRELNSNYNNYSFKKLKCYK